MSVFFDRFLPDALDAVHEVSGTAVSNRIGVRRARAGDLAEAYPAGTHDRELLIEGSPSPREVSRVTARILEENVRCRRVVLPVPERDLPAIAWAEDAGFRYVLDVETRAGGLSLLVTEPEWVIAQPQILDDIPLQE